MDTLSALTAIFLLNAAWQITLVTGTTMLLDRRLRRAPARYRHLLWMMALVAAISLPALSTRRSAGAITPRATSVSSAEAASNTVRGSSVVDATARLSRTASARELLRRAMAGSHPGILIPRSVARVTFILYLSFLMVVLARFVRAWLRTREIRRLASDLPLPGSLAAILDRYGRAGSAAAARKGREAKPAAVTILWSAQLAGPVSAGARHPAIILPLRLLEPAAEDDLKAALVHEIAHVRRRDYLCNLICELLLLPVAFHPLSSIIKRRLGETRELACDELAASELSPAGYARALVRMADQISQFALPAAPRPDYTLGVFDADILEERVMRLMRPGAGMRLAKCSLFGGLLLIAILCVAAASFSMAVAQNGQTESNQISPNSSMSGGLPGGVAGGVVGGVPGGVSQGANGGTIGGVPKGVSGGIGGAVSERVATRGAQASSDSEKTGSLSGIVVDSSGARIPKAEVRLVGRNTSLEQRAETDETGNFSFDSVPAGRYSLEVTSPGMGGAFRSFEFKAEGEPPYFPFVLHPGDLTESVVVTGQGAADQKASKVGPRKIRVGGAVEDAKLVQGTRVPPQYPESSKANGIEGLVVLEATISADGTPTDLKVVSSPDDSLSKAALEAVKQWRYQPTLLNGDPVEVVTTIDVDFRLQN